MGKSVKLPQLCILNQIRPLQWEKIGESMEQPKLGILNNFRPLWLEKMTKSAKLSKLCILNKMPECRFPYTTHVLALGHIPVKITICVLCALAAAKNNHCKIKGVLLQIVCVCVSMTWIHDKSS